MPLAEGYAGGPPSKPLPRRKRIAQHYQTRPRPIKAVPRPRRRLQKGAVGTRYRTPGPLQVSAHEIPMKEVARRYPQLDPQFLAALEQRGVKMMIDPYTDLPHYSPMEKRIYMLPGQPVETYAHELFHAGAFAMPNWFKTSMLPMNQRAMYHTSAGKIGILGLILRNLARSAGIQAEYPEEEFAYGFNRPGTIPNAFYEQMLSPGYSIIPGRTRRPHRIRRTPRRR